MEAKDARQGVQPPEGLRPVYPTDRSWSRVPFRSESMSYDVALGLGKPPAESGVEVHVRTPTEVRDSFLVVPHKLDQKCCMASGKLTVLNGTQLVTSGGSDRRRSAGD